MNRIALASALLAPIWAAACPEDAAVVSDANTDLAAEVAGTDGGAETGGIDASGETTAEVSDAAPTDDASQPDGTATTAGVLCSLAESGQQRLVYTLGGGPNPQETPIDETLDYNFAWACDATERTLMGNGVPNHGVLDGVFASQLSAQTIAFTFPLNPVVTDALTEIKEPGYALNSVKFDPATAGTCPDDAVDDSDCNYAAGSDTWNMVATPGNTSPWKFGFGVDENDAHVQPNGQYHYHGIPVNLVDKLNPDSANSMTLVGWAADGFPIYSVQGHSDVADLTSTVVEMSSSYQTVATPAANRPSVDDFPMGHFIQDWEYVAGSGDLDECNGRFGVTPEFPQGIYHYHLTRTYPFVQRCVKGEADAGGGPGGPGGPGGGPGAP